MSDKENKSKELERIMSNCYGTENYYTNQFLHFKYTDGVDTFCKTAGAYWLLDIVESIIRDKPSYFDDFVVIKLTVQDNCKGLITFEDSENVFYKQDIPFTDCPKGEWLFYYDNNVFFWNGEY